MACLNNCDLRFHVNWLRTRRKFAALVLTSPFIFFWLVSFLNQVFGLVSHLDFLLFLLPLDLNSRKCVRVVVIVLSRLGQWICQHSESLFLYLGGFVNTSTTNSYAVFRNFSTSISFDSFGRHRLNAYRPHFNRLILSILFNFWKMLCCCLDLSVHFVEFWRQFVPTLFKIWSQFVESFECRLNFLKRIRLKWQILLLLNRILVSLFWLTHPLTERTHSSVIRDLSDTSLVLVVYLTYLWWFDDSRSTSVLPWCS